MRTVQKNTAAIANIEQVRDAVLRVATLVPSRAPLPVLSGIRITFLPDLLRFEAGDFLQAGYAEVPASTALGDTIHSLVDGVRLARVTRRAPGDALTLIASETTLTLTARSWNARLICMPVEDYPDWTGLLAGAPTGDDDPRTYGNGADGARPLTPDGVDRALQGRPIKGQMWTGASRKRSLFRPAPFEVGDWLEFTDDLERTWVGQVWSAATKYKAGTLLVIRNEIPQPEPWPISVTTTRKAKYFYTRDPRHEPDPEEQRSTLYSLRRADPTTLESISSLIKDLSQELAA
ncbi:hypothetical protein AB0C84_42820 [Actinomadura sp. NPDC048955]|uniref:hypothetical protein n=1 Tax=Actinomadura sp. NPDC048955 TaxID=3158228 RepID=UPI0033C49E99